MQFLIPLGVWTGRILSGLGIFALGDWFGDVGDKDQNEKKKPFFMSFGFLAAIILVLVFLLIRKRRK